MKGYFYGRMLWNLNGGVFGREREVWFGGNFITLQNKTPYRRPLGR